MEAEAEEEELSLNAEASPQSGALPMREPLPGFNLFSTPPLEIFHLQLFFGHTPSGGTFEPEDEQSQADERPSSREAEQTSGRAAEKTSSRTAELPSCRAAALTSKQSSRRAGRADEQLSGQAGHMPGPMPRRAVERPSGRADEQEIQQRHSPRPSSDGLAGTTGEPR